MIQSLNRNLSLDKITMPYPHVKVLDPSDAVALVVPSLPTGDLPVICEYKGSVRKIASVKYSALVLDSLRKISRLEFCKNDVSSIELKSVSDIMEAL